MSNPFDAPAAGDGTGPAPAQPALADRTTRLAGSVLDWVFCVVCGYLSVVAVAALTAKAIGPANTLLFVAPGVFGGFLANTYLTWKTGQSVGRIAFKMKVVRADGSPILFSHAFTLLESLFIFGTSRRCGHDWAAGTVVIWASEREARDTADDAYWDGVLD